MLEYRQTDRLDFEKMKLQPGTLIPRDFRHIESDMIFSVPFRLGPKRSRRTVTIYLLIEHQSEPDALMSFRVLEYEVHLLRMQLRAWKRQHPSTADFRFQPIVPIVFYTGKRAWSEIPALESLFLANEEFREVLPAIKPLFLNIGAVRESQLRDPNELFAWVVRLLRTRESDPSRFKALVNQLLAVGDRIPQDEKDRWKDLLTYLHAFVYHHREPNECERLSELIEDAAAAGGFQQEIQEMKMTMAERHRREGRQEERLESRRQILLRFLSKRFGQTDPILAGRIESESNVETLDEWIDRAATAHSLKDVGIN